jgi:hypothetical protein
MVFILWMSSFIYLNYTLYIKTYNFPRVIFMRRQHYNQCSVY